eukprot:TRINITY_DN6194_c0_g1_i1.p1 TRINITY_DN6194_c0_g1~~TRINITY_DN6194_c0_g1_i1.p1  ORF type:complete len:688 (+),score=264.55 TRINITY_DN6194_c0_g1_i1:568-2631(+)
MSNNQYYSHLKQEQDEDSPSDPNLQNQIQQSQSIQQQQPIGIIYSQPQNFASVPYNPGGFYSISSFPSSNPLPSPYPFSSNLQRTPSMMEINQQQQQEQFLNAIRQQNQNSNAYQSFNPMMGMHQNRYYAVSPTNVPIHSNLSNHSVSPLDYIPQHHIDRSSPTQFMSISDPRMFSVNVNRPNDQIQWSHHPSIPSYPPGYFRMQPNQFYSPVESPVPAFLLNPVNVSSGSKQESDSTEDRNLINSFINNPAAQILSQPNPQGSNVQQVQQQPQIPQASQQPPFNPSFPFYSQSSFSPLEGKNEGNFPSLSNNNNNNNSNNSFNNHGFATTTTTTSTTFRTRKVDSLIDDEEIDPFSVKSTKKSEPEKKRKKGSSSSSASIQKVEGVNVMPLPLPPVPDYSSIPLATRFKMKRQPHNHQRRCYEDENRYVMPNPLIVMEENETEVLPNQKILDGFVTAMLADDDGNLLSDSLPESERLFSPDGLSHKISSNNTRAAFNVKLFAPAGRRSRFRIVFLVNYQTADGNSYWEKVISDVIQIQCNKIFAGQDPTASSLMPTRGSPLEETEVWIRGHDFWSKGMKITFDGIDAKVLDISENLVSVIAPRRPDLLHKGDLTVEVSFTNLFTRKQAKSPRTINYTYSVNLRRPQGVKMATTDHSFPSEDSNVNRSSMENVNSPPNPSRSRRRRH